MRRRFSSTDGLLLLTVVIWSLNITVTKYILTHGLQPLAYSAVRFGIATSDLRRDHVRPGTVFSDRRAAPAHDRGYRRRSAAPQPGLPRLLAAPRQRDDGRADPRDDADLHWAVLVAHGDRASDAPLLARRRSVVRRGHARRRRRRELVHRGARRRPRRDGHVGNLGRLLGCDCAPHARVLALPHLDGCSRADVASARAAREQAAVEPGMGSRLARVGGPRICDRRTARA